MFSTSLGEGVEQFSLMFRLLPQVSPSGGLPLTRHTPRHHVFYSPRKDCNVMVKEEEEEEEEVMVLVMVMVEVTVVVVVVVV
ncbi:hypothetical protein E2C01_078182 [Portunus trituberculatus]|uniref:Uncharacterized protein n=1 Tax=Portunus trituberculatus TaxID=210409 RepID=A0A5B7IDB2_PORTR|nr:hypothetical protein [Portunus trituberculatus]